MMSSIKEKCSQSYTVPHHCYKTIFKLYVCSEVTNGKKCFVHKICVLIEINQTTDVGKDCQLQVWKLKKMQLSQRINLSFSSSKMLLENILYTTHLSNYSKILLALLQFHILICMNMVIYYLYQMCNEQRYFCPQCKVILCRRFTCSLDLELQ